MIVEHDVGITIHCNVTKGLSPRTKRKRISWFKDGVLKQSVENPDPSEPLVIKKVSVRDGGVYSCLLEVLLRNVKGYHVSDSTVLRGNLTS